jgi:hypothetical protein
MFTFFMVVSPILLTGVMTPVFYGVREFIPAFEGGIYSSATRAHGVGSGRANKLARPKRE